jgi:hypothetical protein
MAYFTHALIQRWPEPFKSVNGISLHALLLYIRASLVHCILQKRNLPNVVLSYSEKPHLIAEAKQLELCQPEHQTPPC